jgi:GNAT superfamily N-acetyltransferase
MKIRVASVDDIGQIQRVRHSVRENRLSNPKLVTDDDCEEFITKRGKGWVWDIEQQIVGFAIVDLMEKNVWALFVDPNYEKQGIGRQLHDAMIDWYFSCTQESIWLGTAPNTRAETFYRQAGWREAGTHGAGERRFEMSYKDWTYGKAPTKVQ